MNIIDLYDYDWSGKTYNGDFDCSSSKLTSLKGAPEIVNGNFLCFENELTSLEGAPKEVGSDFDCSLNKLTSLKEAPRTVGRDFYCVHNKLTSLKGAPKEVRHFNCSHNKLDLLKGAPGKISGQFTCSDNDLPFIEILEYILRAEIGDEIETDYDFDLTEFNHLDYKDKVKMIFR